MVDPDNSIIVSCIKSVTNGIVFDVSQNYVVNVLNQGVIAQWSSGSAVILEVRGSIPFGGPPLVSSTTEDGGLAVAYTTGVGRTPLR